MKKYLYLLLVVCLVSCGNQQKPQESGKPTITVTIEPLRYFVEQIAGGKVEVNTMVPAGSNPETYEPTAQQMVALSNSTLYIKVGQIGFETTWMEKLQQNAPGMKIIDSSLGIIPAKTINGVDDPHTWMSCSSARIIAKNICQAMKEIAPQDSAFFQVRYDSLLVHIDKVDAKVRNALLHAKEKAFVIYHPALTYFARDYQLTQLPIEEEGREPSARQIQALIDKAKRERITTVFIQKEFANRNVQTFIDATHAKPFDINPLSYEWEQEMIKVCNGLNANERTD